MVLLARARMNELLNKTARVKCTMDACISQSPSKSKQGFDSSSVLHEAMHKHAKV
jgi:hypothetical protein